MEKPAVGRWFNPSIAHHPLERLAQVEKPAVGRWFNPSIAHHPFPLAFGSRIP